MRMAKRLFTTTLLIGAMACGGDSGTGPSGPSYETIADTYVGTISGVSQGIGLNADFTLTLAQSAGSLSGTYGLDGAVTDGVDVVGIAGSGTITGSIAAGSNPAVNITIRSSACPNYSATYSGTYDSANRRINLLGPVDIFEFNNCSIALRFTVNMLLQR